MSNIIEDGSGKGHKAKVDDENRLFTNSVTSSGYEDAIRKGIAFTIGTGVVNLTSDSESQILYFTNDEDRNMVIEIISVQTGNSTGGSGDFQSSITVNPTGGTLISAGANGVAGNKLFGSANTLNSTIKIGAEGSTVSGGVSITDIFPNTDRYMLNSKSRLPKGTGVAFSMKPPTGNTSVNVAITIALYLEDVE